VVEHIPKESHSHGNSHGNSSHSHEHSHDGNCCSTPKFFYPIPLFERTSLPNAAMDAIQIEGIRPSKQRVDVKKEKCRIYVLDYQNKKKQENTALLKFEQNVTLIPLEPNSSVSSIEDNCTICAEEGDHTAHLGELEKMNQTYLSQIRLLDTSKNSMLVEVEFHESDVTIKNEDSTSTKKMIIQTMTARWRKNIVKFEIMSVQIHKHLLLQLGFDFMFQYLDIATIKAPPYVFLWSYNQEFGQDMVLHMIARQVWSTYNLESFDIQTFSIGHKKPPTKAYTLAEDLRLLATLS